MRDKDRERSYVVRALEAGAQLPRGNLLDSESPDFLLETPNGRKVGIEVTRFARHLSRGQVMDEEAQARSARCHRSSIVPRPIVKPEELAVIVARKEARLPAYRCRAEDVWLLIVFGAFRRRCLGVITDTVAAAPFTTSFAGVALYDLLLDRAWSVPLRHSPDESGAAPRATRDLVQPVGRL